MFRKLTAWTRKRGLHARTSRTVECNDVRALRTSYERVFFNNELFKFLRIVFNTTSCMLSITRPVRNLFDTSRLQKQVDVESSIEETIVVSLG